MKTETKILQAASKFFPKPWVKDSEPDRYSEVIYSKSTSIKDMPIARCCNSLLSFIGDRRVVGLKVFRELRDLPRFEIELSVQQREDE
jgi:hypothetical protein